MGRRGDCAGARRAQGASLPAPPAPPHHNPAHNQFLTPQVPAIVINTAASRADSVPESLPAAAPLGPCPPCPAQPPPCKDGKFSPKPLQHFGQAWSVNERASQECSGPEAVAGGGVGVLAMERHGGAVAAANARGRWPGAVRHCARRGSKPDQACQQVPGPRRPLNASIGTLPHGWHRLCACRSRHHSAVRQMWPRCRSGVGTPCKARTPAAQRYCTRRATG